MIALALDVDVPDLAVPAGAEALAASALDRYAIATRRVLAGGDPLALAAWAKIAGRLLEVTAYQPPLPQKRGDAQGCVSDPGQRPVVSAGARSLEAGPCPPATEKGRAAAAAGAPLPGRPAVAR